MYDISRRKAIVMLGGFLIDNRVAWNGASAPARLPDIFNGMHKIIFVTHPFKTSLSLNI